MCSLLFWNILFRFIKLQLIHNHFKHDVLWPTKKNQQQQNLYQSSYEVIPKINKEMSKRLTLMRFNIFHEPLLLSFSFICMFVVAVIYFCFYSLQRIRHVHERRQYNSWFFVSVCIDLNVNRCETNFQLPFEMKQSISILYWPHNFIIITQFLKNFPTYIVAVQLNYKGGMQRNKTNGENRFK